ncbi:MAG: DsbA family protein [Candidatus Micrarchaeota archaeon]
MSENSGEHSHHGGHSGSSGADTSTQMYVLAFAFLVGAALLSASIFFSMGSISASVNGLASTLSAKDFALNLNGGSAPTQVAPTPTPTQPTAPQPTKVANIVTTGRPARGDANAPVTIVEFSDFQCPFCQRAYPTISQVEQDYAGKIKLVYMQFPLNSLHPYAQKAAEASECAQDQGKFWEYYDTLFTAQTLDVPSLKQHAADLGLDTVKFNACLDGGTKAADVAAQENLGSSLGVSGTPSFFINGKMLVGAQPYGSFKSAIDAALAG